MAFLSAYTENNKIPLLVNHTRGVAIVLIAGILSREYFEAVLSRAYTSDPTRYATYRYKIIAL